MVSSHTGSFGFMCCTFWDTPLSRHNVLITIDNPPTSLFTSFTGSSFYCRNNANDWICPAVWLFLLLLKCSIISLLLGASQIHFTFTIITLGGNKTLNDISENLVIYNHDFLHGYRGDNIWFFCILLELLKDKSRKYNDIIWVYFKKNKFIISKSDIWSFFWKYLKIM